MKKFKLTWGERVCDFAGDTLYFEHKSQVIEAKNDDDACALWEKEHEYDDHNGLHDCVEVVESELFKNRLLVDMPDGLTYAIPVEIIARHRAQYYANKEYDGDIAESLRDDTLPLFEEDPYNIRDWAANNMNWSEVKLSAVALTKKIDEDLFEDAWVNGEWSVK